MNSKATAGRYVVQLSSISSFFSYFFLLSSCVWSKKPTEHIFLPLLNDKHVDRPENQKKVLSENFIHRSSHKSRVLSSSRTRQATFISSPKRKRGKKTRRCLITQSVTRDYNTNLLLDFDTDKKIARKKVIQKKKDLIEVLKSFFLFLDIFF